MKRITLLDEQYDIIKDESESFDLETVTSLATDYFKPYDYIFGDYSYGKLRLKGFYDKNNKKVTKINNYNDIDEYIKKYCAYNCKFFIIKKIKK
jgi:uncharacterized protein YutD